MQIADPAKWLEDLQARVADVQAKSAAMTENLAASSATVTSKDGAVTVTISPTGALQNLELKPRAAELTLGKLTASIMEAVRKGQRSASERVVEAFAPLGAGHESMDLVLSYLPPAEESGQEEPAEGAFARPADEEPAPRAAQPQPTPQLPPQPQPAAKARPTRPEPVDDVDPDNNPW